MYRELLTKSAFWKRANDEAYQPTAEELNSFVDALNGYYHGEFEPEPRTVMPGQAGRLDNTADNIKDKGVTAQMFDTFTNVSPGYQHTPMSNEELTGEEPSGGDQLDAPTRNALLAALADKSNYGALAALSAAGLGGLGGAAFGGNANDRILNAITGAAGGAGAVGGARGAMELLEGSKVDPLLAAGLGGVTGGIGSGALARLLAKTLMK